jgi:integrase
LRHGILLKKACLMAKRPKPITDGEAHSIAHRAEALDALDGILPFDRREQLAGMLSDDDVATLRHLAQQGLGENSLRALASDLFYLEAWCLAATGAALPWPAPEPLLLKFVAHHLWDFSHRESDASHGMPAGVAASLRDQGLLRLTKGPHAPATVRRKLSSWSTLTRWRGLVGAFNAPGLKSTIKLAIRATERPRQRKSQKAITSEILAMVLQSCGGDSLVDCRDRALLLLTFASGGRRRSEVAALRHEQLVEEEPVPADPNDPDGGVLPCWKIRLGRTKTGDADGAAEVFLIGRPVTALQDWIIRAKLGDGAVFRAINRWGHVQRRALTPQAVNLILKRHIAAAGLDPSEFSAHGLRSGYLTEAARRGIPLLDAMQQSQHRSVNQAARYYNDAERRLGRAARLLV